MYLSKINKVDKDIDLTDNGVFIDKNLSQEFNSWVLDFSYDNYQSLGFKTVEPTHIKKVNYRLSKQFLDEQYDYGIYKDLEGKFVFKRNFESEIYCERCSVILTVNEKVGVCIECYKDMGW